MSLKNFSKTLKDAAEELAELDPINDAVWTLRSEVLECLKTEGFLPVEAVGSENNELIHHIIRRLLELV